MTHQLLTRLAAAPLALAFVAACSTGSMPTSGTTTSAAPTSATAGLGTGGPDGARVTLRLADAEGRGQGAQPWIDRFINEVSVGSSGNIAIEPIYKAGGGNINGPGEAAVANQVMSGEVELGLVPVRAWSDAGVTSLDALMTPFLIDSDELLTAVAADPLIQPLLDDMSSHGLIGLAAWPEDLRHPFAWEANGAPFVKASDLVGAKFWTLHSGLQASILEGMGAEPVTSTIAELDAMVADGSLRGIETSFGAVQTTSGTPTATGDVVLYPKYQVLVAEDAAFSRLTEEQQQLVRDAAIAARDLAIADHVGDTQTAQNWCDYGGRVVLAGDDNIATFHEAAEPILEQLTEDPLAATAIAAIRELKQGVSATRVAACDPAPGPDSPWPSVPPGPDLDAIPDGVYVYSVTRAELDAAGVNATDAKNNAGKWTMTVSGDSGVLTLQHEPRDVGSDERWPVSIESRGDRIRLQLRGGSEFWDFRWRPDGGDIYLEVVGSDWNTAQGDITLNAFWRGTWTKVE